MAKTYSVEANGERFTAQAGEVLLDAALAAGVEIPHDCRSGHCGTCLVEVHEGRVLGGASTNRGCVHACRAHVFSDIKLRVEELPEQRVIEARLIAMRQMIEGIWELVLRGAELFAHLPGQYYRYRFKGFPARCFSPTATFEGTDDARTMRLHVKVVRDGRVTPALGDKIRIGHAVNVEGPFGRAYLRPEGSERLVLVGTGTGFAPVWAVADAALRERADRSLVLMGGARRISQLYMAPALARAATCPNVIAMATTSERQDQVPWVLSGCPVENLPPLAAEDIVYAAGAPAMVEKAAALARTVGARFYADPFVEQAGDADSWLETLRSWRRGREQGAEARRAGSQ